MNSRLRLLLLLVFSLVLVACGSGQEAEQGVADQTNTAEDSSGATDPATATVVPTVTAEPTATPEPSPSPTLAPTPTETVAEAQPAQDQGDAQRAAMADGSGWGASGTSAQSACDHPYLPLRPGATWSYETSGQTLTWEVLDVQGDLDAATAVLGVTVGDVTIEYHWDCVASEGIASFDFANLGVTPTGTELIIEQVSIDGQFLLPPEQLVAGATWTTNLESKISFTQEAGGTSVEATGDMINVQQNTILSNEPIEYQGQSVAGLQVEQINDITMALSIMDSAVEQRLSITNDYEMGYGIGIINQSSVTDFGPDSMALVSYSIP